MKILHLFQLVVVLNLVENHHAITSTKVQSSISDHEIEIIEASNDGVLSRTSHERFQRDVTAKKVTPIMEENEPDFTTTADGTQMFSVQRELDVDDGMPSQPCKPNSAGVCVKSQGTNTPVPVKVTIAVNYTLFNVKCKQGEALVYGKPTKNTKWNVGKKAVFVIHGWLDAAEKIFFNPVVVDTGLNIKNAYIESNRPENIILVNWAVRSDNINYLAAAKDSHYVGVLVAKMIAHLKNQTLYDFSQVKLVGFSFGSHVAGVAGHYIHEKYKTKVAEITGLDPEEPLFEESHASAKYRLEQSDANFVQIINCNNFVNLLSKKSGTMQITGHANFYPNGGSDQPGCKEKWKFLASMCSHLRCGELYASTVRGVVYGGCPCENAEKFKDIKCPTCNCTGPSMGDLTAPNVKGDYCLTAIPHVLDAHL